MKKILSLIFGLFFICSCCPVQNTKAFENKKAKVCLNYTARCSLNFNSDGSWSYMYRESPESIKASYEQTMQTADESKLEIHPTISLCVDTYQDNISVNNHSDVNDSLLYVIIKTREDYGIDIPIVLNSQLDEHICNEQVDYLLNILPNRYDDDASYNGMIPAKAVSCSGFNHNYYTVNVYEDVWFEAMSSVISSQFNAKGEGDYKVHGLSSCLEWIATTNHPTNTCYSDAAISTSCSLPLLSSSSLPNVIPGVTNEKNSANVDEDHYSALTISRSTNAVDKNKTFSQFIASSNAVTGVDIDDDIDDDEGSDSKLTSSTNDSKPCTCENENKSLGLAAKISGGLTASSILAVVVSQVWQHVKPKQSTVL